MKVYTHKRGITLVGKGWEIVQKLKEYQKDYVYVTDWLQDLSTKK